MADTRLLVFSRCKQEIISHLPIAAANLMEACPGLLNVGILRSQVSAAVGRRGGSRPFGVGAAPTIDAGRPAWSEK